MALFFVQQLDWWRGDGLVNVAATEASAVGAVPIAFDDHGAAATGAVSGERVVHRGSPFQGPWRAAGANAWKAAAAAVEGPSDMPAGLADGFGLKAVLRADALMAPYDSPLSALS